MVCWNLKRWLKCYCGAAEHRNKTTYWQNQDLLSLFKLLYKYEINLRKRKFQIPWDNLTHESYTIIHKGIKQLISSPNTCQFNEKGKRGMFQTDKVCRCQQAYSQTVPFYFASLWKRGIFMAFNSSSWTV